MCSASVVAGRGDVSVDMGKARRQIRARRLRLKCKGIHLRAIEHPGGLGEHQLGLFGVAVLLALRMSSLIDRIEVDEGAIRMFGRKDVLEQCVMAGAAANPGVRTFVPKWRAGKDSNTYCIPLRWTNGSK